MEEVLEIVNSMKAKDQAALKSTLLIDEADLERLIKEDFAKYEATFNALT